MAAVVSVRIDCLIRKLKKGLLLTNSNKVSLDIQIEFEF